MPKPLCLLAVVVSIAACSSKTGHDTVTNDSTQVVVVTDDSISKALPAEPETEAEELSDEDATDVDKSDLEKMYETLSTQIKSNVNNLYEATLSVRGYESSTTVLFYFNKSGSLLYSSEDWDMEGQSGKDEYFADDEGLILSLSQSSYDNEGGTVTQTMLWHKILGGMILSESPDGSITKQATESKYGESKKSEFSSKTNALYSILKTGEVMDNGTTVEVKIVEEENYGETFEEVTTLTLPKELYTLLTKE